MLLGMALVILGLLWLISARPKPDFAEAPPAAVSSPRSDAAAYNAATGERAPNSGGYARAAEYPLVPLTTFDVKHGAKLSEVASGLRRDP